MNVAASVAAEDRLDIVTVWIEDKCGIVVPPALAGRPVVGPACPEDGGVECIDLGLAFCCKGGMLSG